MFDAISYRSKQINETCMKKYGIKSEILFDQSIITQTIMQKNLI